MDGGQITEDRRRISWLVTRDSKVEGRRARVLSVECLVLSLATEVTEDTEK